MIITRNPDALDLPLPLDLSQGTSVTVGNFDGVHLGHQALLAMTCERAAATGTLPVAMTFNPHPLEVLTPYAPPRLTTPQARLALLEASGMALVMLVVFTPEFAAMSPETFVRRILLGTLNMRELLLGYDFTLGKGRAGTPEVLAQLGKDGYEARVLADGQLGLARGVEIRAELAEDAGGDGPGLVFCGGAERGLGVRGQAAVRLQAEAADAVGYSGGGDLPHIRATPLSTAARATASAMAGATRVSKASGMMCSGESSSPTRPASAFTAAAFIALFMSRARTESAPRNTPGKARTLFIWFGQSLRPVPATQAPASSASS